VVPAHYFIDRICTCSRLVYGWEHGEKHNFVLIVDWLGGKAEPVIDVLKKGVRGLGNGFVDAFSFSFHIITEVSQ